MSSTIHREGSGPQKAPAAAARRALRRLDAANRRAFDAERSRQIAWLKMAIEQVDPDDPDEAQAIVERMTPKIQARMQAQQIEIMAQARADWLQQIEADAEIGGAAKQASQASAAKALHQFGTPELRVLLKDSGLEAHPEVVRFFSRAGKAISEDSFVSGRPPTKSTAQALYGASNMNP